LLLVARDYRCHALQGFLVIHFYTPTSTKHTYLNHASTSAGTVILLVKKKMGVTRSCPVVCMR
jgi:hypothetical protein